VGLRFFIITGKKKRRENSIPSFAFQWKINKRSSSLEGSPAGSARQHFS